MLQRKSLCSSSHKNLRLFNFIMLLFMSHPNKRCSHYMSLVWLCKCPHPPAFVPPKQAVQPLHLSLVWLCKCLHPPCFSCSVAAHPLRVLRQQGKSSLTSFERRASSSDIGGVTPSINAAFKENGADWRWLNQTYKHTFIKCAIFVFFFFFCIYWWK